MEQNSQMQYVEFEIGVENYAISIAEIHEIIKLQPITEIPNCRHYVKGVINLRGRIVPVLSLRAMFSMEEDSLAKSTRIIVINHKEEALGIMVDKVNKVTTFSDIQIPPERVAGISGTYFTGIGLTPSGLVGILKLDEVLLRD
ncbi:Chemotaxis protein CheW [compost metagenome]